MQKRVFQKANLLEHTETHFSTYDETQEMKLTKHTIVCTVQFLSAVRSSQLSVIPPVFPSRVSSTLVQRAVLPAQ